MNTTFSFSRKHFQPTNKHCQPTSKHCQPTSKHCQPTRWQNKELYLFLQSSVILWCSSTIGTFYTSAEKSYWKKVSRATSSERSIPNSSNRLQSTKTSLFLNLMPLSWQLISSWDFLTVQRNRSSSCSARAWILPSVDSPPMIICRTSNRVFIFKKFHAPWPYIPKQDWGQKISTLMFPVFFNCGIAWVDFIHFCTSAFFGNRAFRL